MTPDEVQDHRVERLHGLLTKKFGGQKVALGRALGHKSGAFVRQLLERERPITEKTVQAIEALPGCSGWFNLSPLHAQLRASGEVIDDDRPGGPSHIYDDDPRGAYWVRERDGRKMFLDEAGGNEPGLAQPVSHTPPTLNSMVRVPLLAVRASMGSGTELAREEEVVRSLSLSPQWISTALRPSRAESLRFIHGDGDSMSPTFNSGDVLLVDTDIADVQIPGVYVLEAQDQLFIKRVNRRLDGVFEISSDNPAHRTVEVLNGDHDVAIKGRVIWVWNGRKL